MIKHIMAIGLTSLILITASFSCCFHSNGGSGSETPNVNYAQARKCFTANDSGHLPNENLFIDTTRTLKNERR
jgi:hypothetical protein